MPSAPDQPPSGQRPPDSIDREQPAQPVAPHIRAACQTWLTEVATNAEAATAAAQVYAELSDKSRDAWLTVIADELPALDVPQEALYGPLLAVEADPARRALLERTSGVSLAPLLPVRRALLGTAADGLRLAVLVIPLYRGFVRLLVCRFSKESGFEWVRQELFVCERDAPLAGSRIDGIEPAPRIVVVSGYLDARVEAELLAIEAVRHILRKPFDVIEFADLVEALANESVDRVAE